MAAEGTMTGPATGEATFKAADVAAGIETGAYVFTCSKDDSGNETWTVNKDSGGPQTITTADLAKYGLSEVDMSSVANEATDSFTVNITKAAEAAVSAKEASVDVQVMHGTKDVTSAFEFNFDAASLVAGTPVTGTITVDNDQASIFHIGANQGQNTSLTINNMDAKSLGIDALDLTSQSAADEAITTIDNAISKVSSQRAALGAMQNRLEHTINNLGTASENLTAAESRIRDVDMAKEMMEFTKNNILSQASQAMLAQANMQPQSVLQLLQ